MINVVVGDLLKAKEDIIVHQVNCQKKMGSGIALQIKNKFPEAYKDYMRFANPAALGRVCISATESGKYIAHVFGQLNYGYDGARYTNYGALTEGLAYIKEAAVQSNKSVAIPWKIGCDRGGADWKIVYEMIEIIFADYSVTLYKLEEK